MDYLKTTDTRKLFDALLALENYDECRKFLRDLLTEAELKEFINRWKVARMLSEKIDYEKITKETGMSSTTIARISKWLNGKIGGYKLMLQKLNTNNHHTPLLAE
jgi:TrpR-related protein YerC/YecD